MPFNSWWIRQAKQNDPAFSRKDSSFPGLYVSHCWMWVELSNVTHLESKQPSARKWCASNHESRGKVEICSDALRVCFGSRLVSLQQIVKDWWIRRRIFTSFILNLSGFWTLNYWGQWELFLSYLFQWKCRSWGRRQLSRSRRYSVSPSWPG
jgi:hypothetical protein